MKCIFFTVFYQLNNHTPTMKKNSTKFLSLVSIIIFNTLIGFGQQSSVNPKIRSSVISFSDIVKNALDHPDTTKKFIGNDFDDDEEALPTYEPFNNRWIFSAAANPQTATSAFLIGVSQTSNPTGRINHK